jgi:hypothetical protein
LYHEWEYTYPSGDIEVGTEIKNELFRRNNGLWINVVCKKRLRLNRITTKTVIVLYGILSSRITGN